MSYSAAEKWQKIGKVGADDKGSADVLSCYRPKLDLTAGSRLEVIENPSLHRTAPRFPQRFR